MSSNFFERAAWYMTTYTDTMSVERWQGVLEDVFTSFIDGTSISKRMSMQDAKAEILHMVRFWTVEVGRSYREELAVHKFKKCNRWNDFYDSKNDPDQFVIKEFEKMVARKKVTDAWMESLGQLSSVELDQVWIDPRTREGMRTLVTGSQARYGQNTKEFEDLYAKIVTTLTSRPILEYANTNGYWYKSLTTLRTEGPLIEELVYEYGDGLAGMKRDVMAGGYSF